MIDGTRKPPVSFDPRDQEMLLQHAALGCVSLWCATAERAYPFVFRRRFVRGIVPCAQLIYCSDVADFVRRRTCRNISRARSAPASATWPIPNMR